MNAQPGTAAHPVVTAATGLFMVMQAAELRRLPMPFSAKAFDYQASVELQFHTRAEVVTWAAALEAAEVVDGRYHDGHNPHDSTSAEVSWFDVPITLVAMVPRMPEATS